MPEQSSSDIVLSFVAPVYNEQDGLERFYKRLKAVADELGQPYEIILVNDGSTDNTAELIARLVESDRHVKAVEFSRNFGHQVAVTAGYDFAGGWAVISLDADCQHPPELIPELVARWREGYEVVYTVRKDTAGISPIRRGIGRLTYRVIRLASGADLTDQADFRLLDRKVVDVIRRHREHGRFVRGLVHWVGFRQTKLEYTAEQRSSGRSSYSLKQLAAMSTAGVFNFSMLPLRLAPAAGAVLVVLAVLYGLFALLLWPFGWGPGAIANLTMAVVGLFGLQFILLGVVGEYVGRTFEEAKGRDLYVVRRTLGFAGGQGDRGPAGQGAGRGSKADDDYVVYT